MLDETELYTPNYNDGDQAPAAMPWGQMGEYSEAGDSRGFPLVGDGVAERGT